LGPPKNKHKAGALGSVPVGATWGPTYHAAQSVPPSTPSRNDIGLLLGPFSFSAGIGTFAVRGVELLARCRRSLQGARDVVLPELLG